MTELITALDGPWPAPIAGYRGAGVRWVKVGAQNVDRPWSRIIASYDGLSVFLDLKLADTRDTVEAAVRRFADLGVASISTYTASATEAALRGAEGSPLLVWQVDRLTDGTASMGPVLQEAHGVICPVYAAPRYTGRATVCPGIRMIEQPADGHLAAATPQQAREANATWAVVGRPIWGADDPVAAARVFLDQLRA